MTDRFHSLTVVLERDIREDDAEMLLNALRMLRGVISVEGNIVDVDGYVAEERVRYELRDKLMSVLFPKKD